METGEGGEPGTVEKRDNGRERPSLQFLRKEEVSGASSAYDGGKEFKGLKTGANALLLH